MGSRIGPFFKYILNINTIWAAMILISFTVASIREHLPQTLVLPTGQLVEGTNRIAIEYDAKNKADFHQRAEFAFRVENGVIVLPEESLKDPGESSQSPWLVSAPAGAKEPTILWKSHTYGKYTVDLNSPDDKVKHVIATGNMVTLERVTDAMFDYAKKGFDIGLGLVAAFVLLLGLMKVGEDAGLVGVLAKVLGPLIRLIFPGIPRNHPANGAILMNITTGILGLGNASTPMGLKAIAELQKLNPRKDTATDAMCMLVGYNTAGFALIPTSIIATMKSAGTLSPLAIIGPSMAAGLASTTVAVILVRVLGALPIFKVHYTQEELDAVALENSDVAAKP